MGGINAPEPIIIVQLTDGPEASCWAKHIIECALARCPLLSLLLISLIKRNNSFAKCHQFLSVWLTMMKSKQGLLINPLSTMVSHLYEKNPRLDLITGC